MSLRNYIKYFHDYAYAPVAQYHIGEIYLRNEQWDDAAKAFDRVVEQFPKNEKTTDAAYYKAVSTPEGRPQRRCQRRVQRFIS